MWDIKGLGDIAGRFLIRMYYLNHVGYKVDKVTVGYFRVGGYYLNHVGYKEFSISY